MIKVTSCIQLAGYVVCKVIQPSYPGYVLGMSCVTAALPNCSFAFLMTTAAFGSSMWDMICIASTFHCSLCHGILHLYCLDMANYRAGYASHVTSPVHAERWQLLIWASAATRCGVLNVSTLQRTVQQWRQDLALQKALPLHCLASHPRCTRKCKLPRKRTCLPSARVSNLGWCSVVRCSRGCCITF